MRRWALLLMIPLNLVLLAWVWFGRITFGVGGWFLLILGPVVLVLALMLLMTTILAFTQWTRPRSLTRLQSGAQVATWAGMFGVGLFIPDFGDTDDSYLSFLTQLFGRSDAMIDASWTVTLVSAALVLVAYVVLLGSLIAGRQKAPDFATVGPA